MGNSPPLSVATDNNDDDRCTTTNSRQDLLLDALSAFLTHGGCNSTLLSIPDLGRLSVSSKIILQATEPTWQLLYEQAVKAGSPKYAIETTTFMWRDNTLLNTWAGEGGLQPCFATTDPAILARVGYKRAAGCLRSKICLGCGQLAATANPLTLKRLCDECAEEDERDYLILKSRAKSEFLLCERDCRQLLSVTVPIRMGSREAESTICLLTDARELAYEKWGGADGLAAEIERKSSNAISHNRVTRASQAHQALASITNVKQRQRKRRKVEKKEKAPRPFEDSKSLRSWIEHIPLGVMLDDGRMVGATECKQCCVRGTVADMVLHERLEHGICPLGFDGENENNDIPSSMVSLDELDWPEELKTVITNVSRDFASKAEFDIGVTGEGIVPLAREKAACLMELKDGECTVASDLFRVLTGSYEGDDSITGVYRLTCQLDPGGVPHELLRLGIGTDADVCYEADMSVFGRLLVSLGLPSTTLNAAQLVAALILASQVKDDFLNNVVSGGCRCPSTTCAFRGIPNAKTPIFRIAHHIVENGFAAGPVIQVRGAGIDLVNGIYLKSSGRPNTYVKAGEKGKAECRIVKQSGWTSWIIKDVLNNGIYSCQGNDESSTPPKNGWEGSPFGFPPYPTVSIVT